MCRDLSCEFMFCRLNLSNAILCLYWFIFWAVLWHFRRIYLITAWYFALTERLNPVTVALTSFPSDTQDGKDLFYPQCAFHIVKAVSLWTWFSMKSSLSHRGEQEIWVEKYSTLQCGRIKKHLLVASWLSFFIQLSDSVLGHDADSPLRGSKLLSTLIGDSYVYLSCLF